MDINRYSPRYGVNYRHMTKLADFSAEEIFEFLYAARAMKDKFIAHEDTKIFRDVTLALLFGDTSLRTRSALEIGIHQLGGNCIDLPYNERDMRAGENIKDIVTVLARYGVTLVTSEWYGFWGLMAVMLWQQAGYMMIIYISGLQSIPGDVTEAAAIDGASAWQTLRYVKLPMLMPSITICTFLTLTNGFKLFDQNLALTGGMPSNRSQLLALNIYDTFYGRAGWEGAGQAKAVVFCVIVVTIALVQLRLTRTREVQQ